ncbi:MAG TPA: NAD-dependent deacylase [Casimicrobiaceae bacterium]|nr:NAD-dependent deacylase [Casimicrobiaceae bacterium]
MASIPDALAVRLRSAARVAVLTGAGVSAESGVPTFRDALTGLWAKFDPRDLATPSAFARNPTLVWDWYAARRETVKSVEPNPGHFAIATMETLVGDFLLVTQNVDGLHARAGSRKLVELHGNIARVRCSREDRVVDAWHASPDSLPPRCPHCGAFLRPDVVWFEEMLPAGALEAAEAAARRCDVFIVAGTSGEVYPAAALPHYAKAAGARVVEVNPDATPLSSLADDCLRGGSATVLPALVEAAWPVSPKAG